MLRKCTAQEDGSGVAAASLAYQENDVLPALQASLQLAEVILIVDRLLIDLEDHVAAPQANVFRERVRLHVLHNHAFAGGRAQTVRQVTRQWSHRDSELAF